MSEQMTTASTVGIPNAGGTPKRRRGDEIGMAGKLILAGAAVVAIYLISVPLIFLLGTAFRGPADFLPFEPGSRWTLDNLWDVYLDPALYRSILPNTAIFAAGSVTITFVIAFTLAWLVERTDLPFRSAIFTAILFPLLVPTVVLAIAWTLLCAPNAGWVNVAIRGLFGVQGPGPINIFTMPGLIICQGIASTPFVFLLLCAALRTMNPSLEEASNTSGASPIVTFFKITLPVLRPGILAPLILATLLTLEQFDLPLIIGFPARVNVFTTRLFFDLNAEDQLPKYGSAAAVALLFLVIAILLLALYNYMVRRAERYVTMTGKGYRPTRLKLGRWRAPALVFVGAYLTFAAVLPALVLLWTSLTGGVTWSEATLSWTAYEKLTSDPRFWKAVVNTFIVAACSAGIATLVGALISWQILRTRFIGRNLLDFISFLSIGIPSVIAGFAVMLLYLSLPIGVYGTIWILVLAYSYRIAVTTRLSRAALMQIHAELEEASSISGAGWLDTIRRIVLPLMTPALLSSFLLLFMVGFREFTIPMMLQSDDNWVLSVVMWRLQNDRQTGEAAAVGTLIVLFVIPIIFLMRRYLLAQQNND
ncbi:iron ABC transporter permease [Bosea caraganae]|uniref:Iron ABC transporter permease n=1 Tax=Bosea caraganae TaxID=2763117 RepID=A0A370KY42_9HYPH|nr:iron ABC transporter permease [Bosea caraganae]RDJ19914.1 iron ABC transporter permease [Bosea caraganae]RDJ23852.1 iron ABC transporter permease [Bosea caraganae]